MVLFTVLQILFSFLFLSSLVESQARLVPALYLFGDSVLDAGNNNYLNTIAKANYPPYGVDFPSGATGRFSNGRTIADFFALWLGTSNPPPYLDPESLTSRNVDGFNYASGSSGILSETGSVDGNNLYLGKQVQLFKKTVKEYLPLYINSPGELTTYLSKSIFMVFIGSNDYLNNYRRPEYNSSRKYELVQFTQLLMYELEKHLQTLYKSGARKFVVGEVGPIGCLPASVKVAKPAGNLCVDELNILAKDFNNQLAKMIEKLRSKLPNSHFVIANNYMLFDMMVGNPRFFGMSDSKNACCEVVNNGPCAPNTTPCRIRDENVFWDGFHPSENSNRIAALLCFNRIINSTCTPMNVFQLTQTP